MAAESVLFAFLLVHILYFFCAELRELFPSELHSASPTTRLLLQELAQMLCQQYIMRRSPIKSSFGFC